MSQLLSGRINLSKIPKDLIRYNNAGEAFVWVDVAERREPSQYGDTHNVSIYDAANRQKIYIGDLRPKQIGAQGDTARPSAFPSTPAAPAPAPAPSMAAPAPAPAPASDPNSLEPQPGDLPF